MEKRIWGVDCLKKITQFKWGLEPSYVLLLKDDWEEACKLLNQMEEKKARWDYEIGILNGAIFRHEKQPLEGGELTIKSADIPNTKKELKRKLIKFQKFDRINLKPLSNE